jgi:MFS family permease
MPSNRSAFSWRYTTPLFIGSALNPINSSMIATALVSIAAGIHVSVGQTAGLVSALYLASTIGQPTAGKAAAVFGPRRVFLAGTGLVLAGGLIGGLAVSLPGLIIGRALIGLGTSCAYPTAMILIRRRATEAGLDGPPSNILGGLQIAGLTTASLGLPLGGVLVQFAGWRSVLFINVPIAVIALVVTLLWIPTDNSLPRRAIVETAVAVDFIGMLGFAVAMTTMLLFLFSLPTVNWALLAATVVFWLTEVAWEARATTPFFDVRLLISNAALTRTYLRFGLVFLCAYIVLFGVTQWIEFARGLSAFAAGLLMLPMSVVSGLVVPPVSRRSLVRGPLIWAAAACLAAGVLTLFLSSAAWLFLSVLVTILVGFALGAASSNQLALYNQADPESLGTASGLMRSFGYLGSITSSAVTGIVFRQGVTDTGVVVIAVIMIVASIALMLVTALDRTIGKTAAG